MANTTFGSQWMHRQLINSLKWIDVRWLYAFTTIFVVPVCLLLNTNHSRTITYSYFRKRHGYGRWKSAWATFMNHCLFSQVVVDRFAIFAGKHFDLSIVGYDNFLHLAEQEEGFMIFSSHVGCYEVAGCTLVSRTKQFNALVYGGEKKTVMEGRKKKLGNNNITMIPILPDMSHLFKVNEALANNEIISMPADRIVGSKKTLVVKFFGSTARLPMGPFSVATMRGLDVIAVNVMKTSCKGYTVYVTPMTYNKQASRKEQMSQLAQNYANELETCIRQYPTQWYNYYDFWKE